MWSPFSQILITILVSNVISFWTSCMLSFRLSVSRGFTKTSSCLRSPTFRHCDDPRDLCFTGHFGQWYCSFMIPFVIGASFLRSNAPLVTGISNPMAFLRRSSFLRAPLMTRLRNGIPVSDALFLGGLICFRICLINSFIVLANDCECFCCFSRTWNCPFRVVVAEGRTARDTYPSSWQPKKKMNWLLTIAGFGLN